MSTATTVPQTFDVTGDAPLRTLGSVGWGRLLRDSTARFKAGDGISHARSLAFQVTLTMIPALIAGVGLATVLDQESIRHTMREVLVGLAPGQSQQVIAEAFQQGAESGTNALLAGLLAALVSGTAAMAQVERGANRIYGLDGDRPMLKRYTLAFLLAITAGLLIAAGFVLLVIGRTVAEAGKSTGGWSDALVTAWSVGRWPVGIIAVLAAFSLLFRLAPNRKQPPASWLAIGSAVAVTLWAIFTVLLAVYLTATSSFSETYGQLAGMVGVLLWALLTSVALFFGIAVAAQLEAERAGISTPSTEDQPADTVSPGLR
jgi:YihY family inner membrane protein